MAGTVADVGVRKDPNRPPWRDGPPGWSARLEATVGRTQGHIQEATFLGRKEKGDPGVSGLERTQQGKGAPRSPF